ncbi:MAG: serpin family protein [Actinocrinis sp.]
MGADNGVPADGRAGAETGTGLGAGTESGTATGTGTTAGAQAAVAGANRLTARWARTCGGDSTVLSGACVWPLLAALSDGASGMTRDELATVVGLPADAALDAGRDLLRVLDQSPAVRTALGLWTSARVEVNEQWTARLPQTAHGVLDRDPARAKAALDAWVEKETDGLLHEMPVAIDAETLLVLAATLTVRTKWEREFAPVRTDGAGLWQGRVLVGLRRTTDVSDLRVATTAESGPVTLATVRGQDEIDVVLALGGPDARAGDVLATAIASSGLYTEPGTDNGVQITAVNLDGDEPGPGLTVREIHSLGRTPTATLNTVAFHVDAHHDLLEHADLFGLKTATDRSQGHFPGISTTPPLCVQRAAQDAMAVFSATGFVAAAVTAVSAVASAAMSMSTTRHLTASFDRPFGFVAVHRPTGLVLVSGWVTDPDDYPR